MATVVRDSDPKGPPLKMFNPNLYVTMFTDASFCDRTKCAGLAVWIKDSDGCVHKIFESFASLDSTRAERYALDVGLEYIFSNIQTDDKALVINADCLPALESLSEEEIIEAGKLGSLKLKHIKAHQGIKEARSAVNDWCDREAKHIMRTVRDYGIPTERKVLVEPAKKRIPHRGVPDGVEVFKTFDEWKKWGRSVIRGQKSTSRDENNKPLFEIRQTQGRDYPYTLENRLTDHVPVVNKLPLVKLGDEPEFANGDYDLYCKWMADEAKDPFCDTPRG